MKPFQGFLIEKNGTAKELKYKDIESVDKDNKILWLHFDYTSKEANDWIRNSSNIDSVAVEALFKKSLYEFIISTLLLKSCGNIKLFSSKIFSTPPLFFVSLGENKIFIAIPYINCL